MRKVVSPREIIRGDYYTKSPLIKKAKQDLTGVFNFYQV